MVFCGGKLMVYGGLVTGHGVSDDLYVIDFGSGNISLSHLS